MDTVADMCNPKTLELLGKGNYGLGEKLFKQDGVEILESEPTKVVAKVSGGEKRTTTLEMGKNNGFTWKCTCTTDKTVFCKHCVALGLEVLKRSKKK